MGHFRPILRCFSTCPRLRGSAGAAGASGDGSAVSCGSIPRVLEMLYYQKVAFGSRDRVTVRGSILNSSCHRINPRGHPEAADGRGGDRRTPKDVKIQKPACRTPPNSNLAGEFDQEGVLRRRAQVKHFRMSKRRGENIVSELVTGFSSGPTFRSSGRGRWSEWVWAGERPFRRRGVAERV
jgi:hypothetical protein